MSDTQDRLAIRDTIERYSDALNARDFAALAALFAPDAVWRVDAPFNLELAGAAIAPGIQGMIVNLAMFVQLTHSVVIDVAGDSATGRTTIHEMGKAADGSSSFDTFGFYHDRLVRAESRWRFAARRFQPLNLGANA
ncbi:MAG TPA: nuclear transport factor 2 family protein [Rhizomicrobium sp.]|nr:nuclear transport factor 2 family protein [Rhizomicrobium sp.]